MIRRPPVSTRTYTLCPYTTRFRSKGELMRRRTLLAAVPAAALLPTAGLAGGPKPKTAPAAPKADAAKPPVWEAGADRFVRPDVHGRSEEHTSELQSLMRNSYAVFRLKKKIKTNHT